MGPRPSKDQDIRILFRNQLEKGKKPNTIKNNNIRMVTTVDREERNIAEQKNTSITTLDECNKKFTTEGDEERSGREDIRTYFRKKITTENNDTYSGREEHINKNSKVTTELDDIRSKGEEEIAKVTSVDKTGNIVTTESGEEQVTTEVGGEQRRVGDDNNYDSLVTTERSEVHSNMNSRNVTTENGDQINSVGVPVPESKKIQRIITLKPPTDKDIQSIKKKIKKKRKFEDEQSVPKIDKIFLSVDQDGLSKNPLKITKPRENIVQRCTDSTVDQCSTDVQRYDVTKTGQSSAGRVTWEISENFKPDLAQLNQ